MLGRPSNILSAVLTVFFLGAAWLAFAPAELGGPATYVIVNGNSMEPVYHRGDLVVLRSSDQYAVGEIATYRHPQVGPVIHRIIGRDHDRYVFKGDHNNFIDPYRPSPDELIGRAWIHVPMGGRIVAWLRTPAVFSLFALGAGVCLMLTTNNPSRQRWPRSRRRRLGGSLAPAAPGALAELPATLLALLALVALGLAALAFSRPAVRERTDSLVFQHAGAFSYSAPAPRGLYNTDAAATGDPVFPQISRVVDLSFTYQLVAPEATELRGTEQLVAELSATNGWIRTVQLLPERSFSGSSTTLAGQLDLAELRVLTNRFEQHAGLQHQTYQVTIKPSVEVAGQLAGQPFHSAFAPSLVFRLDEQQLQLVRDDDAGGDVLRPVGQGTVERRQVEPNQFAFPGGQLDVGVARVASVVGLAVALAGLLALVAPALVAARHDTAAGIRLRYGSMLVEAAAGHNRPDARLVELARIEDLAKLAEKHGTVLVHQVADDAHLYSVQTSDVTYQYRCPVAHTARRHAPSVEGATPPQPEVLLDQWHQDFLATLRSSCLTSEACRAAGISVAAAYRERERVPVFAQAWDEARATAGRAATPRDGAR